MNPLLNYCIHLLNNSCHLKGLGEKNLEIKVLENHYYQ
jgi:hypothetical protein